MQAGSALSCSESGSCSRKRIFNTNISKVFPHLPYFSHPPLPIVKPMHFNLTISKPLPQTQIVTRLDAAIPQQAAVREQRAARVLEEAYPDHTSRLQPADPYERARMCIWTDFVISCITPAFYRFLQYQPAREKFLGYLKEFTAEMDAKGPYFLDRELSLINIAIAPWAVRLWVFDHFKEGGLGLPEEGNGSDDEKAWARWRKWLAAV